MLLKSLALSSWERGLFVDLLLSAVDEVTVCGLLGFLWLDLDLLPVP